MGQTSVIDLGLGSAPNRFAAPAAAPIAFRRFLFERILREGLIYLAPRAGFEPATNRLTEKWSRVY
jgi:hypothetical protein